MQQESTKEEKPSLLGCQAWVLKVVFASICMGVGQFIYATHYSDMGIKGSGFLGPVPFIVLVLIKVAVSVKNKLQKGKFIDRKNSNMVDEAGNLRWKNIIPVLG
mmetsp:Transcript_19120/g.32594  ORF Transcript_19120/g.32594 Transcript_19120/m.32594 type:complete len:104 (+) Transcript_19120:238-549(+)